MLPKENGFGTWVEGLNANQSQSLIAVIAYVLGLLKNTGVDCEGKALSVLSPQIQMDDMVSSSDAMPAGIIGSNFYGTPIHAPHFQR